METKTRSIVLEIETKQEDKDILMVTFDDGSTHDFIGLRRVQHEDIGKAKTPGFIAIVSFDDDSEMELWWITDEEQSLGSISNYIQAKGGSVPRITVVKPMFAGMPVGRC